MRTLLRILGAVAATALLLEGGAALLYRVTRGEGFYSRLRLAPAPTPEEAQPPAYPTVLHPVLGFVRHPGLPVTAVATPRRMRGLVGPGVRPAWADLRANNLGFFSPHDYPWSPPEDTCVVGVFGGSAAQWFALQVEDGLARGIARLPGVAGRRVAILNLAQGGFKQPQQLQLLTYLLSMGQRLDLVINLDGFNEVALAELNAARNLEASLPSSQHLLPLAGVIDRRGLPLAQVAAFHRTLRLQRDSERLAAELARTRSAVLWYVDRLRLARTLAALAEARGAQSPTGAPGGGLLELQAASPRSRGEGRFRYFASIWAESSAMMDRLLAGRRIGYLHVLQPNQYHSGRRFTPEEAAVALAPDTAYAEAARRGYPELVAALAGLRARGVAVLDATGALDDEPGIVFADNCCHLNQAGNEALLRFLLERWPQRAVPAPP